MASNVLQAWLAQRQTFPSSQGISVIHILPRTPQTGANRERKEPTFGSHYVRGHLGLGSSRGQVAASEVAQEFCGTGRRNARFEHGFPTGCVLLTTLQTPPVVTGQPESVRAFLGVSRVFQTKQRLSQMIRDRREMNEARGERGRTEVSIEIDFFLQDLSFYRTANLPRGYGPACAQIFWGVQHFHISHRQSDKSRQEMRARAIGHLNASSSAGPGLFLYRRPPPGGGTPAYTSGTCLWAVGLSPNQKVSIHGE